MIDPSARRPLYRQMADDLHRRIREGEFPPGGALPSEPDLGTHYEVGQHTVRAALDLLVRQGLIVKRHGALARVAQNRPMSDAYFPAGHKVGARPATDEERAEFDLPPGMWVLVVVEVGNELEAEAYPADRFWLKPGPPEDR